MKCPKCGGNSVKNGHYKEAQKFLCKKCGNQYTNQSKEGYSQSLKFLVFYLHINGMKMREAAKLFNISASTVCNWIKELKHNKKLLPRKMDIIHERHYYNCILQGNKDCYSTIIINLSDNNTPLGITIQRYINDN